ncbi:anhydro-N-acetylmuramic acid kinase [Pullulanibacillus pueri]|uniref:Anhydro-N-acetylmuramic acid kinase n=1 Tax=Pullulanibacillus pueri TaxID=1437324 RepID=A0A8J2ZZP7_9BACL|nr:anhydro-N-acetylmuramic acid kinase [Pullulanibacillus pueri]MBM7683527.1 anhydro-N-acetylmuramic acid kinase [Pullulanibacillus pueri]GGH86910.1 anhydro-N-acetylmuramic acid kinase [Pullulanibacillus pueri]
MSLMIGLNSGTSFDGIDAVLIEITMGADGHPNPPKYIDGLSMQWPKEVQKVMLDTFANKVDMEGLGRLNYVAGAVFANVANALLDKLNLSPFEIDGIAVDGQTIYQEQPDHKKINQMTDEEKSDLVGRWFNGPYPICYQLVESNVVAAHTNITTITHFRQADHAFGGNGAPLMQYLDWVVFKNNGPTLTLNLGGIANVQFVKKDRSQMIAFDTGPGNVLLDHACRKLYNISYDKGGRIAAEGQVNDEMLQELMKHPYFERELPRSAWRNDFSSVYGDSILEKFSHLSGEDIMATFCAFTAKAIAKNAKDNIPSFEDIKVMIASGGGVFNPVLMEYIQEELPKGMRLTTSDEYGIPPQFKEAIKFATIGYSTLHQVANNIPGASHADNYAIMGKVAYAPRHAKAIGLLPKKK